MIGGHIASGLGSRRTGVADVASRFGLEQHIVPVLHFGPKSTILNHNDLAIGISDRSCFPAFVDDVESFRERSHKLVCVG